MIGCVRATQSQGIYQVVRWGNRPCNISRDLSRIPSLWNLWSPDSQFQTIGSITSVAGMTRFFVVRCIFVADRDLVVETPTRLKKRSDVPGIYSCRDLRMYEIWDIKIIVIVLEYVWTNISGIENAELTQNDKPSGEVFKWVLRQSSQNQTYG